MAAIAEEFFARGLVYPFMSRLTGSHVFAAFFASSLWAVLHVVAYGFNIIILTQIMCVGLILAYVMEKSQSLDVPILVHLANNLMVSLAFIGV